MEDAAKGANIYEMIMSTPNHFETRVRERREKKGKGQREKFVTKAKKRWKREKASKREKERERRAKEGKREGERRERGKEGKGEGERRERESRIESSKKLPNTLFLKIRRKSVQKGFFFL